MSIRKVFEKHIKQQVGKTRRVAVLLSSGLDGLVVGLAAQDAGYTVHAYTFQMGDDQSFDSRHAEKVAEKLGWRWTLIKVPTSVDTLTKAWPVLRRKYRCVKKRDYECAYPMFYCYKRIADDGHKFVLSGLIADAYFCFARSTHIAGISGHKSTLPKFDAYRKQYWRRWFKMGPMGIDEKYNPSGLLQHNLMCDNFGLTHVNPWLLRETFDFFIGKTWQELNTPKQKMPIRVAWKDYIDIVGHHPHRSYQTEAKVSKYFEQLFLIPKVNFKDRNRIMDIARDWSKL